MEYFRMQMGNMMILLYICFSYAREKKKVYMGEQEGSFWPLLGMSLFCVLMDGATVWTVNHLDTVPEKLNLILHALFLISIDLFIFILFLYMLARTEGMPKSRIRRICLYLPFALNLAVVVFNMDSLYYCHGRNTNYSMGIPVYTCYTMAGIYLILTILTFVRRWNYIERHKRAGISVILLLLGGVTTYQMLVPESLVSSLGVTMIILGVYVNMEDPALQSLSAYHKEMVMGLAAMVESRDGNTGAHIRRTNRYVELLARELRKRGYCKNILTKDYIDMLSIAASMHDIGKVAVPDAILQKPGKLTPEEFEIIKRHSEEGGRLIEEVFAHMDNQEFKDMAYQVARYHHEKWNGKGYPDGLKGTDIPLSARIMAVADVFDAVSERRCYRDAMPLETCFEIIRKGAGEDFDPMVAEVFLELEGRIREIRQKNEKTEKNEKTDPAGR